VPVRSAPSTGRLLRAEARRAGFRRVELVSIVTGSGRPHAAVTGVLHRYLQTVPVSLATARRLAAAGAPLRVRSGGGAP